MTIAEQIRGFIQETFFAEGFSDGDSLLKEAIIDSTGMLELVSFVEETFEITVQDQEVVPDNLDSVRNLTAFIERKRAQRPAA